MCYKVIQDDKIIDVLNEIVYVKIQIVYNRLIVCPKKFADGILSSDMNEIWFVKDLTEENKNKYPVVELVEIEESEYNILAEALNSKHTIEIAQETPETDEEKAKELTDDEKMTLDFVKQSKILEMSNVCNSTITKGFDITLSDSEIHHFDFAVEDQLNIISLKDSISAGEKSIPYHASNEACRFFSVEDIQSIINAGASLKIYQITYFNALKLYINSLDAIDVINSVKYGMDIPKEYQSEVLVALLKEFDKSEELE